MSCTSVNEYGQTVGFAVSDFLKGRRSSVLCLEGRHCTVDHLSKKHEESLYQHLIQEGCVSDWTYLPYEMPDGKAEFQNFLSQRSNDPDAYFFAVLDRQTKEALGIFSLMRINESMRSIEMGCIIYQSL